MIPHSDIRYYIYIHIVLLFIFLHMPAVFSGCIRFSLCKVQESPRSRVWLKALGRKRRFEKCFRIHTECSYRDRDPFGIYFPRRGLLRVLKQQILIAIFIFHKQEAFATTPKRSKILEEHECLILSFLSTSVVGESHLLR